jgi:hypothetical protein
VKKIDFKREKIVGEGRWHKQCMHMKVNVKTIQ